MLVSKMMHLRTPLMYAVSLHEIVPVLAEFFSYKQVKIAKLNRVKWDHVHNEVALTLQRITLLAKVLSISEVCSKHSVKAEETHSLLLHTYFQYKKKTPHKQTKNPQKPTTISSSTSSNRPTILDAEYFINTFLIWQWVFTNIWHTNSMKHLEIKTNVVTHQKISASLVRKITFVTKEVIWFFSCACWEL